MSEENYKELVTVVLSRIILFNAKRGGEAGRMSITNYRRPLETETGNDYGLNELEKKLTGRYDKILFLSAVSVFFNYRYTLLITAGSKHVIREKFWVKSGLL